MDGGAAAAASAHFIAQGRGAARKSADRQPEHLRTVPAGCLSVTAASSPPGSAQHGKGAERRIASPRLRLLPASPIPDPRSRFNGEVTSTDVSSRHPVRPAAFTYFKEIRIIIIIF